MYEDKQEMEEEFDKLVVDLDYEFDANCFFDFTRPEPSFEAEVSETWFHSAPAYPPSPFIVKHKWREEKYSENWIASLKSNASKTGESITSSSKNSDCDRDKKEGLKHHSEMVQNTLKTKEKSLGKSPLTRSSTLMKPTLSHLAKLKSPSEIYASRSVGRSPKSLSGFSETSSRSPLSVYQDATKRQKLDIGYLLKKSLSFSVNQAARLKHQKSMLHKLSKVPSVVADTANSRPKPTIPREPYLETVHRAQRHRSRNNPETDVNAKLKPSSSKELLVNKKILKTSPLSPQIKGEREPPALQKLKHSAEIRPSCNPPTELFKKLSLKSEVERNAATRSKQLSNKVAKENVPGSFRREMSVS